MGCKNVRMISHAHYTSFVQIHKKVCTSLNCSKQVKQSNLHHSTADVTAIQSQNMSLPALLDLYFFDCHLLQFYSWTWRVCTNWNAASSSTNLPLWLTSSPHISSWPAVVLPSTADPKKTPTTKRPSNLMFILAWWVQPAQSDFHWLALNWNCIHLNHPSHPKQPVETKAALIARTNSGSAPSPMHLAFLIGKELLCLHWL